MPTRPRWRSSIPATGKTKRAYLWAYRSNGLGAGPPIVVFDYQASRAGSHAVTSWRMARASDGGRLCRLQGAVPERGSRNWLAWRMRGGSSSSCIAANQSPIAKEALERIGKLYAIEQAGQGDWMPKREALRQCEAKPVLDALFDQWLWQTRKSLAQGSGTAKAIDYSLKRWAALIRYADSGDLPIDNNPVENAIRPIAIGKKNWLFAGSERAGKRAAAIQSLIGTARLNGLDPAAWLRDTLEKLPAWPNSRIDELLPLRARWWPTAYPPRLWPRPRRYRKHRKPIRAPTWSTRPIPAW
jgi:transposase